MLRFKLARLKLELEEREGRRVPWSEIAEGTGISAQVLSSLASRERVIVTNTANLEAICRYFQRRLGRRLEPIGEVFEFDPELGADYPVHVDEIYRERRRRGGNE